MKKLLAKLREERGATAVEYALMVALIALAIIGAVALVGSNLNGVFGDVSTALTSAPVTGPPPAT